jgi:hypothetical protein
VGPSSTTKSNGTAKQKNKKSVTKEITKSVEVSSDDSVSSKESVSSDEKELRSKESDGSKKKKALPVKQITETKKRNKNTSTTTLKVVEKAKQTDNKSMRKETTKSIEVSGAESFSSDEFFSIKTTETKKCQGTIKSRSMQELLDDTSVSSDEEKEDDEMKSTFMQELFEQSDEGKEVRINSTVMKERLETLSVSSDKEDKIEEPKQTSAKTKKKNEKQKQTLALKTKKNHGMCIIHPIIIL